MAFEHIIQNFTHVIKHKPGVWRIHYPLIMTLGAPPSNSVWYITIAISKQTENELLVLKRTEAEEERGKDDGGDDDDYDDDIIDEATFGLQPAVHYGLRHLFIYIYICS